MLPSDLAAKIRYIQIYTSKAVNDALAGEYESVFKGQGMEFSEVRQYQIGDSIRSIDWNVTARMGEPFVKKFVEERELSVLFLVDLSASGRFGSRERLKNETAAELCALLSFSAIKNNDKVGLLLFTDEVEHFIPPGKGTSHVLRVIREVLSFQPERHGTSIVNALDYLGRVATKKSVVFLISDFLDDDYENKLSILSRKHDLIAVSLHDEREENLPNLGLIELEDAETGEIALLDTGNRAVREAYAARALERKDKLVSFFRAQNIDHIAVKNGTDYVKQLVTFFRTRERRSQTHSG
jgi:uncharacterized protein (DUF58 family)